MSLSRRELLTSLAALAATRCAPAPAPPSAEAAPRPIRLATGDVDWQAVRDLFPLAPDWVHLASFLLVSHPRPVAESIEFFRRKIDADPAWLEAAAFSDTEGRPFAAVKRALAGYLGGQPDELCLTSNTTGALAMAWHGLRIRRDQEIVTTEHEHYSHHESIRLSAERSGASVRRVALYDRPSTASADEMVERVARAIRPSTRAIGLTWVHSSTGVKVPIAPVAEAVARANRGRAGDDRCLLIVDGVHGFGNQDVDVASLGCDFFASGTHKWLLAPRGTGFLWGRADVWPAMRPTIPTFDPDAPEPWEAWMEGQPLPPTRAAFLSPGGFLAFENVLAVTAAVELHDAIGRTNIGTRIGALNNAFRQGAAGIRGVTLHTPLDPAISGGLSCFEVEGVSAEDVASRLAAQKIRTNSSPYKTSYARVAAGVMNNEQDIDRVLEALRAMA